MFENDVVILQYILNPGSEKSGIIHRKSKIVRMSDFGDSNANLPKSARSDCIRYCTITET